MRFVKRLTVVVLVLGLISILAVFLFIYPKFKEYQKIADGFDLAELDRIPAISEVFDFAGMRYSRLAGEVRYVVPFAQISPNFVQAVLAREDSRFHQHHGIDFTGISRAAARNLKAGSVKEGASTITQQLARNTFDLGNDRWRKKIVEALLALRLEKSFSKVHILEAYANRIYYGVGMYGVETAARACFGKPASELTLSEAAVLAGLIRSPNRLSPLEDSRTALTQRDQVLGRMEDLRMITPEQAAAARQEALPAAKRMTPRVEENYVMDAVMRDLAILIPNDLVERGGLKIYTTIDRRLQLIAEDAVKGKLSELETAKGWPHPPFAVKSEDVTVSPGAAGKENESPYIQGALVAIDNESGGLRAIVGGRDFKDSPFNRAVLAKRQIGSTFKPFVYAAAFGRGMAPGTLIDDSPITEGDIAGLLTTWSPENSDGENQGLQPAAIGLVRSRNTMTVRVGEFATRGVVRALAVSAGLENVPDIPAIYLGAFETTLKNLTAAYTMFPNDGVRRQPYVIERIDDRRGKTIYKATRGELRCISSPVDYVMNELLRDVIRKGTGAVAGSLGLTVPAAGKTGTTNDYKDAWFVGYTSRLTCGVWVGMDRPQRIADRGYGSKLALPIWVEFMEAAASWKYLAKDFTVPGDLRTVELCRISGAMATPECRAAGSAYQARLPGMMIPPGTCPIHGTYVAGFQDADASPGGGLPGSDFPSEGSVPRAEAVVPVAGPVEPTEPPQGVRIIRKQKGFIFQNSR